MCFSALRNYLLSNSPPSNRVTSLFANLHNSTSGTFLEQRKQRKEETTKEMSTSPGNLVWNILLYFINVLLHIFISSVKIS